MLPLLNFSVQPLERLNMPALRFPQTLFVHLEPRGSKKLIVQCECTSPDNECPIIEFFYQLIYYLLHITLKNFNKQKQIKIGMKS
jgi:hypothetical protein